MTRKRRESRHSHTSATNCSSVLINSEAVFNNSPSNQQRTKPHPFLIVLLTRQSILSLNPRAREHKLQVSKVAFCSIKRVSVKALKLSTKAIAPKFLVTGSTTPKPIRLSRIQSLLTKPNKVLIRKRRDSQSCNSSSNRVF